MKQRWPFILSGAAVLCSAAALLVAVLGATVLDDKGSRTTQAAGPAIASNPRSLGATSALGVSTATFGQNRFRTRLLKDGHFYPIIDKNLSAGSWAIVATANVVSEPGDDYSNEVVCQLLNPRDEFIGGGTVNTLPSTNSKERTWSSVSMNGGVQISDSGGVVRLQCKAHGFAGPTLSYAQLMALKIDGFSG
jgi:hypothetical protein